jgi:hypothetical protein
MFLGGRGSHWLCLRLRHYKRRGRGLEKQPWSCSIKHFFKGNFTW